MPPGLLSLVALNVLLHVSDPDQASKRPVGAGSIDTSLKSLASKVSFYKNLFFIVQITNVLTTYTMWISFLSLSLSPSHSTISSLSTKTPLIL